MKASQQVEAGGIIKLCFPLRTLELEIEQLPGKSTSKKAARELYRVISDEKINPW